MGNSKSSTKPYPEEDDSMAEMITQESPVKATTTVQAQEAPGFEVDFTPKFDKLGKTDEANISWQNLSLQINGKPILKDINGHVNSGEVTALLGPSGAGKSSLLNILAGRILQSKKKKISGAFFVNGEQTNPVAFRTKIAYVIQQDALFATATCREAFMFSANLRLPKTVTKAEKLVMVEELLISLGLTGCADTYIGSELVRGISGGEKKRVAIGVELVTNPSTLFLDEPTSGLDSYSAWKVVHILKALAANGCSVLCTVHQPSSEIFSLFDNVILLSTGSCIYNGKLGDLPEQFEKVGYGIPALTNPADYVMMLLQTKNKDELPSYNVDEVSSKEVASWSDGTVKVPINRNASTWTQSVLLMKREFLNLKRDTGALIGRFLITSILNLLFAFIFYQVGDLSKPDYDFNSHFGAIINIFITGLFGATQPPLLTFPLERVVFLREYSTGSYGALPYLFSKLLVEIPLNGAQALLVIIISYWLMALNANFIFLVFALWLIQVTCASYAFLIGALVPDAKAAQEIAPAVLVPQLLFAGFFIAIDQIPEVLRWVQYVCALKFAVNIGTILEFSDECNNATDPQIIFGCERVFEGNDVDEDLTFAYIMILVGIFVVFRTLSLIALIWRAKNYTN